MEAHDRRRTAVHEAGHFVVAKHCGLRSGVAWIQHSETSDHLKETLWIGQFQFKISEHSRLSLKRVRMIAIAGMVAEHSWQNRFSVSDDYPFYWEELLRDQYALSPQDWSLARETPGDPSDKFIAAANLVAGLLQRGGPLWPELVEVSAALIREPYVKLQHNRYVASGGQVENADGELVTVFGAEAGF